MRCDRCPQEAKFTCKVCIGKRRVTAMLCPACVRKVLDENPDAFRITSFTVIQPPKRGGFLFDIISVEEISPAPCDTTARHGGA